ncbi:hypothetical protein HDV00_007644 [Rhizophlyctis rosea]|nr:hypothetical protein HDV00_007644 [Rhizophlyctis rosea]
MQHQNEALQQLEVNVITCRHSFPFKLLIPADLPPTVHTGKTERDVTHVLFAALHRPELPRLLVQKKEIFVRRCVPRFDSERRMVSGVVGQGYISFVTSLPDPYYMGDLNTINAQASRSVHSINQAEVTGAEFVFKEVITFRNPDKTVKSKKEIVLGPPIATTLSGPQSEMLRVPIPKALGQPDLDSGDISVTHEVWFSIKYRRQPGEPETLTSTVLPIRFALVDEPTRLTGKNATPAAAKVTQQRTLDKFPALSIDGTDELVALRSWQPSESDELAVRERDGLAVWIRFDDGWCYGRNLTSLNVGVFPLSVVGPASKYVPTDSDVTEGSDRKASLRESERKSSRQWFGGGAEEVVPIGDRADDLNSTTSPADGKLSLLDSGVSFSNELAVGSSARNSGSSAGRVTDTIHNRASISSTKTSTSVDLVNQSAKLLQTLPPRQDSLEEGDSVDALQYRVHTSWMVEDDGDLDLMVGDLVVVISDAGNGNAVGFNCRTSQHGVFPLHCIDKRPATALDSSDQPLSPISPRTHPIRNQASIQRRIRVGKNKDAPMRNDSLNDGGEGSMSGDCLLPISPVTRMDSLNADVSSTSSSPMSPVSVPSVVVEGVGESGTLEELDGLLKCGKISGAEYLRRRGEIKKSFVGGSG